MGRKQAIHLAVRISLTAELFSLGRTSAFGRFATWRLATQSGRSPKDGLALPPSQRSFAFQDFIAHPSLRGIVMRALVPHYVRLDRYPHW